jgi:CHAD domain-containing protein
MSMAATRISSNVYAERYEKMDLWPIGQTCFAYASGLLMDPLELPTSPALAEGHGDPAATPPDPASARLRKLLAEAEELLPEARLAEEEWNHDLRVSLRRIRVLCRELSAGVGERARPLGELAAGATGLFRALGELRDLDILRRELEGLVHSRALPDPFDPGIAGWLERERERLRAGLPAAVTFFGDELARFRERGLPEGSRLPGQRGPRAVRAALRRPARRLLKELARARAKPTDENLHQVRIRGKKLRYAGEAVWRGGHGKAPRQGGVGDSRLESGLKKLQDALGAIQDSAMVVARLDDLAATGALAPSAAGPARVAAANERGRRKADFLEELERGGYETFLHEVRQVAAKQGEGNGGASQEPARIELDKIPGIGAAKVKRLEEAGLASPEALKAASLEELSAVKTIGPHQARLIKEFVESGDGDRASEAKEGEPEGKRFERIQSVLALGAVVSDYGRTLAEELARQEEGDANRAGRQAERLVDRLADLPTRVEEIPTKKLKGLRGELRESEGLLAKVLDLDSSTLKMNKLRKALKAHRKAIEAYLA